MRIFVICVLFFFHIFFGLKTCANISAHKNTIITEIYNFIPQKNTITYTKVPRGIILNVAKTELFENNSLDISTNGKILLKNIANLLNRFSNDCSVEVHSPKSTINGASEEDWEISIQRATTIAQYLIRTLGIDKERIFSIGYGEIMPFNDTGYEKDFPDDRIDFVIYDYTTTR